MVASPSAWSQASIQKLGVSCCACQVVTPVDPRIHFALVCGAKSCPPIKLYSPDTLEEGLAAAAEAFIAADVEVDKQARKVRDAAADLPCGSKAVGA